MKRITTLFASIAIVAATMAFTPEKESINFFEGTFSEALKASENQNKPIFIDSYTTSCTYCKKMDKTTFKNKEVVNYLNANFITIKINMRSDEGTQLKEKYGIDALPTLLFINSEGKSLVRINGFADTETFIKKAKKAKRKFE